MRKKILYIAAAVLLFAALTGCRGKRNVSVVIAHNDAWGANVSVGGTVTPYTGNGSLTYDLGDEDSTVAVTATKATNNTSSITVSIIESYEAGFIYLASEEVMATASSSQPNAIVSAAYDFSPQ